ncbi:MAG: glycosyltransferase family 2 protein [Gaiellaceae bacterium]
MATVSIGIPVYNGARFLATSLESLLDQTYEDIEFLISDNGSTDDTEEICRDFASRDRRIAYLRADTNRGASWNYRNVAHRTRGRYFKWATHDDLLAPTYIEKCVEVLESAPDSVALVYPRTSIIDENGDTVRAYEDNLDIRDPTPHERLRRLVVNIVMSNASFGLIRRSTIERSRLLDSFPSADYVMMAEFAMLGELWEIPDFLFFRREHPGMSRVAHRTPAEAAEWFQPGSGASQGKRVNESWRLFVEHLRSIHALPLGRPEQARCYRVFLPAWLRRHGPRMATEPFGVEYTRGWKPLRPPASG